MSRSILNVILLLAATTLTLAVSINTIPSSIAAGSYFTLPVSNDLMSGSASYDRFYDAYRLYLSMDPKAEEKDPTPACYLVDSVPITTTSLTFQMPPSIGANGRGYQFAFQPYPSDLSEAPENGLIYSSSFSITNSTVSWSIYELSNPMVGDFEGQTVPCGSYNCVRQCCQSFYPSNSDEFVYNEEATCALMRTVNCVNTCPGVGNNPWEDDDPSATAESCAALDALNAELPLTGSGNITTSASNGGSSVSSTYAPASTAVSQHGNPSSTSAPLTGNSTSHSGPTRTSLPGTPIPTSAARSDRTSNKNMVFLGALAFMSALIDLL